MKGFLKHAFAVDEPGPCEPTPRQQPAVDWVCRWIARRKWTTPGLVALEMSRPLNYIASQVMRVAEPLVWSVARKMSQENYAHFASFLEHRGSVEYLCQRIEELEEEYAARETAAGSPGSAGEEEGSPEGNGEDDHGCD